MSRSYKKAIIKEKPRNYKRTSNYWRKIRRVQKHFIKQGEEPPARKVIINDYDYCDYIFNMENIPYEKRDKQVQIDDQKKYRRK